MENFNIVYNYLLNIFPKEEIDISKDELGLDEFSIIGKDKRHLAIITINQDNNRLVFSLLINGERVSLFSDIEKIKENKKIFNKLSQLF